MVKDECHINSMKKQLVILVICLTVVFLLANYSKDIFKTGYSMDIGKNGSSGDVLSNFSIPLLSSC